MITSILLMGLALAAPPAAGDGSAQLADLDAANARACSAVLGWRPAMAWAPDADVPPPSCFLVRLDVAGRAVMQSPAVGISQRLELSRSQADLALHSGPATARVAMVFTRSGAPTGYLGINGEALVPELQNAEGRIDLRRFGIAAALGIIDDLWVVATQEAWDLRLAGMTLGEDRRWITRSDAGAWVAWTAPTDVVSVAASITSGEGANLRERNDGKDLTGLVVLRPLALFGQRSEMLEFAFFGREGSRGLLSARNHRVGGRVSLRHPYVGAGFETLRGWGLDVDPSREPRGSSIWLRTGSDVPALAWARIDVGTDDVNTPDSRMTTWRFGAGPLLPFDGDHTKPIYATVVYEGGRAQDQARPIAGAEAGQTWHLVGLKLGVRLDAGVGVRPLRGVVAPPSLGSEPEDAAPRPPISATASVGPDLEEETS